MKRFLIIIFVTIFNFKSIGQNFTTILPNDSSLYTYYGQNYSPFSFINSYRSVAVDSSHYVSGDQILYHYSTIRPDTSKDGNCTIKKLPNWAGIKTILKNNGDNLFLTRAGDTVVIKTLATVNDTWTYCKLSNGNYYEATVTSKIKGTVLAIADSIKIITLNLKASDGSDLTDVFNGKQLLLSQTFGLVKAYDFFSFPLDTGSYIIAGTSKMKLGAQGVSAKEIFDYSVGDEFHINSASSYPPGGQGIFIKERREVLKKNISTNQDTIKYTIRRTQIQEIDNWDNYTSTHKYSIDTIEEKNILSNLKALDLPPLKYFHDVSLPNHDLFNIQISNNNKYNNRQIKYPLNYIFLNNDSCFSGPVVDADYLSAYYIRGLGGPYHNSDESIDQDHYELAYFKKGTETWGEPIDFTLAVSNSKSYSIQCDLFPNPASDNTTLKINNSHNYTNLLLEIKDMLGNTLMKNNVNANETVVSLAGFNKGIYILTISNENEIVSSKKLIKY